MLFGFGMRKAAGKKISTKTVADYRMQAFLQFGRDQIMKLRDKGINIKVALL